jgi:hypothetical protein
MRATADFYLANGCKMVWLGFPDKKLWKYIGLMAITKSI